MIGSSRISNDDDGGGGGNEDNTYKSPNWKCILLMTLVLAGGFENNIYWGHTLCQELTYIISVNFPAQKGAIFYLWNSFYIEEKLRVVELKCKGQGSCRWEQNQDSEALVLPINHSLSCFSALSMWLRSRLDGNFWPKSVDEEWGSWGK